MGGIEYIVAKELKDLYALLGGAFIMAATTTGDTKAYHQNQVKLLKQCCIEAWEGMIGGELTDKQFRQIVYKWFKDWVESELTDYVAVAYKSEAAKKAILKAAIDKWLETGSNIWRTI